MADGFTAKLEKGRKVRLLERNLDNPSRVLKRIGLMLTNRFRRSFDEQKRGSEVWPPRGNPNVMGILSDLSRGAQIKDRRFEDRPALKDTGRLQNSISWAMFGRKAVEVGTNVPYASVLHFGGETEKIDITEDMKVKLGEFLKQRNDQSLTKKLAFLFRRDEMKVKVKPRPFVKLIDDDRNDIRALISGHIVRPGEPPKKKT